MGINETNEQVLLQQIAALEKVPVALEALWDGDTTGWFVELQVVVREIKDQVPTYRSYGLTTFRSGGDIRLFHRQVPPWPESELAQRVGQEVATRLEIPFYFPSPSEPDDDCPHWWEQERALRCQRCGKLVLPRTPWTAKGLCYACYLRERARDKKG